MCFGKSKFCTELGTDPEKWSSKCPLPPPTYLEEYLNYFIESYKLALKGQKDEAIAALQKIRSDKLREWYVVHSSYSGHRNRVNGLGKPLPEKYIGKLDARERFSVAEEREINQRDNYICRYCEGKVIDKRVLKKMEKKIGSEHFKVSGNSNAIRHGLVFFIRATVDHVLPRSYGGLTDIDNSVTSCWSCNYGKRNALLYQMGIDDPRDRPIINKNLWDGLTSLTARDEVLRVLSQFEEKA